MLYVDKAACARSLISIESGDGGAAQEATSERESAAVERTAACIAGCRLEDLFADSKFLRAESLHELVKAIMWAAGPIKRAVMLAEESDTAQVSPCFPMSASAKHSQDKEALKSTIGKHNSCL